MTNHIRFLVAIGLALVSLPAAVLAERTQARGLDFRAYLSLERGMTEGQVLGIAGQPDLSAKQGVAYLDQTSTQLGHRPDHTELAVRTYTYLPTLADPYTTTITLVGGAVTDIRRDASFDPPETTNARGLDFYSYLSLKRDMTEGQLLSTAGKPDVLANQGVSISDSGPTQEGSGLERIALAVRTYTYLPTLADPETTTITFVGGRVTDIRRDKKY